jgi:protein-S-isoprenylcysteine O-methyltransferase Ste14
MTKKLWINLVAQFLVFPFVMGALLFLPAGTFDYWQAWVCVGLFFLCSLALSAWLVLKDPKLLERRMRAGPRAETETSQKVIVSLAFTFFAGAFVVPALDHRFGWSHVPLPVVILGDALIALSYVGFYFVFRANTYGAATIKVEEDQQVISTGPYAIVRHPMYAWGLVLMVGLPLALGSWWGLLASLLGMPALVWRMFDEEKVLSQRLAGYVEYTNRVKYRLVPHVW